MATREEKQAQIAALQAELEADDDTELWVEHERGGKAVRTKLSGSHAKTWLDELFGPAAAADGGQDGDQEDDQDGAASDKKPAGGGYFAKRKA